MNGIRWGHYVGSPDLPEPSLVLKQRNHGYSNVKPVQLTSLADGSCVGYPAESMPLVLYGFVKKGGSSSSSFLDVLRNGEWLFRLAAGERPRSGANLRPVLGIRRQGREVAVGIPSRCHGADVDECHCFAY